MIELCQLIMEQYLEKMDKEYLEELQVNFDRINKLIKQKEWLSFSLRLRLMEGKNYLIRMEVEKAVSLFKKIIVEARETGYENMVKKCEEELRNIEALSEIREWGAEDKKKFIEEQSQEFFDYAKEVITSIGV